MGIFSDVFGSIADFASDIFGGQTDWKRQKKLAQQQIQWKVADAKAAGVHPIYALGAPTMSYTSTVGPSRSSFTEMGQNITRARLANLDAAQRREELARAAREETRDQERHEVQMEQERLRNDVLRSELARANSAQLGPAMPRGSVPEGTVVRQPSEVVTGSRGQPQTEPGVITDYSFQSRGGGRYGVVRSRDTAERLEDDIIGGLEWQLRNNIVPRVFGGSHVPSPPPRSLLPAGYHWAYDRWRGEFYMRPDRQGSTRRSSRRRPSYSQRPGNF